MHRDRCDVLRWRDANFSSDYYPFLNDNRLYLLLCFTCILFRGFFRSFHFSILICFVFVSPRILITFFLLTLDSHKRGFRACTHHKFKLVIGGLHIPIDVLSFVCCVCHFVLFGQIHRINIVYWLAIHTMIIMFGINNNLHDVLGLDLCVFH